MLCSFKFILIAQEVGTQSLKTLSIANGYDGNVVEIFIDLWLTGTIWKFAPILFTGTYFYRKFASKRNTYHLEL